MPAKTRRAQFSVSHVALLLPWITAVVAARLPISDNSFLWHITAGELQINTAEVLTSDPFSFTHFGTAWRTQSWLLELFYGYFHTKVGLSFVTPFMVAAATITFGLIQLATYNRTRSVTATVIVGVVAAWLSAAFMNPRPVLVSYALLALVVAVATHGRLRWTLPLIAFLWAAVHGSFILGIGYILLRGFAARDRRAVVDAAGMAAVSTFTAHGLGVWQVLIDFGQNQDSLDTIIEWATPDLVSIALAPFLFSIVLLLVAGIRGKLELRELWVIVPFLVFAATANRAVFPAWIPLAPFVGTAIVGWRRSSTASGGPERRVLAAIAVGLVCFPLVLPVSGATGLSDRFPAAASRALTAKKVFHDDFAGGYLIYAHGPDRQVFVDDRAELYGADHMGDMIQARNGYPGWSSLFAKWDVKQALLAADTGLATALRAAGWRTDYEDDDFVVLSEPA